MEPLASVSGWKIAGALLLSVVRYLELIWGDMLYLSKKQLHRKYRLYDGGMYTVFRETISTAELEDQEIVFVVGFRLKLIGKNRLLHWLFQKICICTTPFWSGFQGFHRKLWLVNTSTGEYAGMYTWSGKNAALYYLRVLHAMLPLVSIKGSFGIN